MPATTLPLTIETLIDRLNAEFGPAFHFTVAEHAGIVQQLWQDASSSAEIVSLELELDTADEIAAYAADRVLDAYRVLLWGYKVSE